VTTAITVTTTVTTTSTSTFGPAYVYIGTPLGAVCGACTGPGTKPLGTVSAAWIDATASAILEGMLTMPKFGFDTTTGTTGINQLTGQPNPPAIAIFVMSG